MKLNSVSFKIKENINNNEKNVEDALVNQLFN